jgi:hypothetical protein
VQSEWRNGRAGVEAAHRPDGGVDRPADEVGAVRWELVGALALPRHIRLGVGVDRDLVAQIERQPEAVEPGAEVRGRGRDARGEPHGGSA